jgi:hypothetical protein
MITMLKVLKESILNFFKEEDGMGVVEIIIIIAVLVSIALFFRKEIFNFVGRLVEKAFPSDLQMDNTPTRGGETTN